MTQREPPPLPNPPLKVPAPAFMLIEEKVVPSAGLRKAPLCQEAAQEFPSLPEFFGGSDKPGSALFQLFTALLHQIIVWMLSQSRIGAVNSRGRGFGLGLADPQDLSASLGQCKLLGFGPVGKPLFQMAEEGMGLSKGPGMAVDQDSEVAGAIDEIGHDPDLISDVEKKLHLLPLQSIEGASNTVPGLLRGIFFGRTSQLDHPLYRAFQKIEKNLSGPKEPIAAFLIALFDSPVIQIRIVEQFI